MAISVTCSGCERGLKVKDELAGRKIKCPKCGGVVVVPTAAITAKPKARPAAEDDDERPRSKKVEREEEDDEEEEEQPRKKKKKKKKGVSPVRYIAGGVVLVALIVVLVVVLMNKKAPEAKKVEEPVAENKEPEPEPQPQPKGKPPPEQPKTLAQNIRQAALRPERQNELKQIGIFFKDYVDSRNGKNPATLEEFTNSIKVQFPLYVKFLNEKTYILNLKVNMRPGAPRGVIVYDPLIDGSGHQACGTDLSVSPIPTDELKKLLQ